MGGATGGTVRGLFVSEHHHTVVAWKETRPLLDSRRRLCPRFRLSVGVPRHCSQQARGCCSCYDQLQARVLRLPECSRRGCKLWILGPIASSAMDQQGDPPLRRRSEKSHDMRPISRGHVVRGLVNIPAGAAFFPASHSHEWRLEQCDVERGCDRRRADVLREGGHSVRCRGLARLDRRTVAQRAGTATRSDALPALCGRRTDTRLAIANVGDRGCMPEEQAGNVGLHSSRV
mmetsp:Transcript_71216/g.204256  ORF Transcript_71216/g.204256 Transcript_71216/m.204256 type:complete len:232 (-) Transcript_71216:894-1589(-)